MTQNANDTIVVVSNSRLILSRVLLAVAYLIAAVLALLSFSPQLRLAERRASPAWSGGSGVVYGEEGFEGRYGGRRARRLEDEEAAFNASFDFSRNETWKEGFFNMTLEIEKWRAGGGCDRFRERIASHLHVDLLQDDDPASWPPNPSLQVGTTPTASPHHSITAQAHHYPLHPPPPFSLTTHPPPPSAPIAPFMQPLSLPECPRIQQRHVNVRVQPPFVWFGQRFGNRLGLEGTHTCAHCGLTCTVSGVGAVPTL
ncbi:unnamed protein product [Closterium sp. NIES-54]